MLRFIRSFFLSFSGKDNERRLTGLGEMSSRGLRKAGSLMVTGEEGGTSTLMISTVGTQGRAGGGLGGGPLGVGAAGGAAAAVDAAAAARGEGCGGLVARGADGADGAAGAGCSEVVLSFCFEVAGASGGPDEEFAPMGGSIRSPISTVTPAGMVASGED